MIFNNFEKYKFNGTEVVGLKTTINFSKDNDIDIVLHEETQDKFEQVRDLETVKDFPPLVFSVEIDRDVINNLDIQNQIQKLILLDGHHRFEHLSLYNYDYPIPVVLVSNQDVKIQSYNSKINVTKEQFIEFLIVNDFEPSSSKYFLSIQDNNYSNKKINSIYELYDFKRKLINSKTAKRQINLTMNTIFFSFSGIWNSSHSIDFNKYLKICLIKKIIALAILAFTAER